MPSAMARAVTFVPIVEQLRDEFGLNHGSGFDRAAFFCWVTSTRSLQWRL